jgi:outer membrane protein OmpA-like peptidoglycan-associated protein
VRVATSIILIGILAVGSLGFVWVQREAPEIERELLSAATAAIGADANGWAHLNIDGRDLEVEGMYPSVIERDRVLSLAAAIPGVRLVVDASVAAPASVMTRNRISRGQAAACQRQLDALLANETIHFEVLSAAISPASKPLLDDLAQALRQCPDARIEIAGHTDGEGIAELNLKLSEARAESIRNFLVHKGIDSERLVAIGFGSSRPIADDLMEEGRMQNRRIEFKVQGIDS